MQYPELNAAYSKMLQYEPYRLRSNIKALSALKKKGKNIGKLRFKSRNAFKTFTYNQSGFSIEESSKRYRKLALSKIGSMRMRMHRKIDGAIKQITVKHCLSGNWYAIIAAEKEMQSQNHGNNAAIGIDLGTINFIHDSRGNRISHPKLLNKSLSKLKNAQQILSRKKKGSKNKGKQRIKVAKLHEKIMNQRDDFLHKLSRRYVNEYGFIAVEDLDVRRIISKAKNARNIMDASWSKFLNMLQYKAESAGVVLVKVNPKNTSAKCSSCGRIVIKSLSNRLHICECGLEIDRDYNAARNILARALGQKLPDLMPDETKPLHASFVNEAGSPRL
jgi:putative transposase